MSTTIQIKRSSTASGVPLSTDLAVGELAVNLADKRLFTKQSDGTIIELSTNPTDLDAATLRIDGVEITASATELNKLEGFTGSVADLNYAKDLRATGVTTAELDVLDGITATTTELNYTDGVTSNIQTQLNGKATSAQGALADSAVQPNDNVSFGTGSFSGEISANGGIALGDNDKATFGTGDDLQIYHDGTDSFVSDAGTGSLRLRGSSQIRLETASGTQMISADDGGAAKLYHNGIKKISTTSTGVDVTGTVTADGLSVQTAQGNIYVRSDASAVDFLRDGSNYFRATGASGDFRFATGNGGYGNVALAIDDNNDVYFYEDTGTTAKMVWDASAEGLSIGGTALGKFNVSDGTNPLSIDSSTYNEIQSYNRPLLLNRQGNNVGIGTASPSAKLEVAESTGSASANITNPAVISIRDDDSYNGGTGDVSNNWGKLVFHSDDTSSPGARIQAQVGAMYDNVYGNASALTFGTASAGSTVSERMRIDSVGNVGIGTASPGAEARLSVAGGRAYFDAPNEYTLRVLKSGVAGAFIGTSAANTLNFYNGTGTERARIDSSGNLLVGTTDSASTRASATSGSGHVIQGGSSVVFTRQSASSVQPVAIFNDTGFNGDIVQFNKDGSTVGSIGVKTGTNRYLTIGCPTGTPTGLIFDTATASIGAWNVSTNSGADDTVDLGYASRRFKDLYLSGGVYLGGTGSDNKLDDYETGNWTPRFIGSGTAGTYTATITRGRYVKVGNIVTVWGVLIDITGSGGTSNIIIEDLPFTIANDQAFERDAIGSARLRQFNGSVSTTPVVRGIKAQDYMYLSYWNSTDYSNFTIASHYSADMDIGFTLTYETNA